MVRRVTAIVFGAAAAAWVVVILRQRIPHPDRDSAATAVYMLAAIGVLVAAGLIAIRRSVGRRSDPVRVSLACLAGMITFLVIVPAGCDDVGGVPDWERCVSYLGNPTLDSSRHWALSLFGPLLLSISMGGLAWWLVGSPPDDRRAAATARSTKPSDQPTPADSSRGAALEPAARPPTLSWNVGTRRRAVALGLGVVTAVVLAIAMVLRYSTRGPLVVSGLFVLAVGGVVAYRRRAGRRTDMLRAGIAGVAGLVTLLGTFQYACYDDGGWKGCVSVLRTPLPDWISGTLWPYVLPLLLSAATGVLVWRLIGSADDHEGARATPT
jgi:hypothetical protein